MKISPSPYTLNINYFFYCSLNEIYVFNFKNFFINIKFLFYVKLNFH